MQCPNCGAEIKDKKVCDFAEHKLQWKCREPMNN